MDFRPSIRKVLKKDRLAQEEFIDTLITVKDATDRQREFYQNVKTLEFATKSKSTIEKINDGEIQQEKGIETDREKVFVDELMNIRSRQSFL